MEKLVGSDNAVVAFWNSGKNKPSIPQQFLEPLHEDTPEVLLWERPAELASLAKAAPLKLVATVLSLNGSIDGKRSKEADIQEKLHGRVAVGQWEDWWQKCTKSMVNAPEHFRIRKDKGIANYTLLTNVEDVPEGSPTKKAAPPRKTSQKQTRLTDSELLALLVDVTEQDKAPPELLAAAQDAAMAVFKESDSARYHYGLDRILDFLPPDEGIQIIREVIVTAAGGKFAKSRVSEFLASSRHVTGAERLPLLVVAGLWLTTDQRREVVALASRELSEAFVAPDEYNLAVRGLLHEILDRHHCELDLLKQDHDEQLSQEQNTYAGALKELRQAHAAELGRERQGRTVELEKLRHSHESELEKLRHSHESELEKLRVRVAGLDREQERLRQQVRDLDAELRAKREESRLEIRKDMLLAIGEVLQIVARHNGSIDDLAKNVEAGLTPRVKGGRGRIAGYRTGRENACPWRCCS